MTKGKRRGFKDLALAFPIDFDRAVFQIMHPAVNAQMLSGLLGEIAESNALNTAANKDTDCYGGWGHYLMIASFPEAELPWGSMMR